MNNMKFILFKELSNPTLKTIYYWVKYEGNNDFTPETDEVRIDPKSIVKFKVKFSSRISKSVGGRITFTNKKEGNAQAAALVFELKSNVNKKK